MSRQVREAKKFVRGRRFLIAAAIAIVAVGVGITAGTGSFSAHAAGATPVNGDALCGYSGTTQFTESTVVRWAQVNGQGSTAKFIAYANDENSTLLGVNTATPMGATDANHAAHASPGNGGDTTQHDQFGRPYYPALYITNTTAHPLSSGQGVGDWQQGGTPRNINGSGTPFVNDVFGTWVVGTQTVNPSNAPGLVGTLANGPLSTTVNTTHLDLQAPLPAGKTVTAGDSLTVATTGHTLAFVASGGPYNPGATSINVVAKKSNFAYPNGSTITDTTAQTGNYARQATLPTKNDWNLGSGSDAPVGATFASMGDEGYGTEFRWNISDLTDSDGNALTAGNVYKIQMIEHDGDQNKGGDSGEFCAQVQFPGISTTATGQLHISADGTGTVSDSATVSGVQTPLPSGANKVTFKVYGPDPTPGTNNADDCLGTPQSRDVNLNSTTPNQSYPSGDFTVGAPGDYHFTADLTIGGSVTASSLCDATGETATVGSRPTQLTTDAGGPYAPPTSLTDTATLSGGTSNAGGSLTFTLYADNGSGGCGLVLGTDGPVAVTGADGDQYTGTVNAPSPPGYFAPGTYHWSVVYTGDASTGNDPSRDGVPCPATDTATNHENPVVLNPSINIDKSPKNQTIETGGTATWTITVTNDGTAPLTNVVITDANSPNCNRTAAQTLALIQAVGNHDSTFDPSESFNYNCSKSGLTGTTFHNVIDVTATSGGKTDVTDEDFADVKILNPSIDVLKTPPSQSVPVGGTANFNIAVTNDGDTGLTNVVVQDPAVAGAGTNNCALTAAQTLPLIQAVGNHDSTFDVGETFNYNCTSGPVTAAFLNVADACGTDSLNTTVCDESDNGGNPPPGCPEASRCGQVDIESVSTTQDFKPKDSAHLSGFTGTPNGNMTFLLYKDPAGQKTCAAGDLIYSDTVAIGATGNASTTSASFLSALNMAVFASSATAGNYNWKVSYSGDTNGNADVAGACGTENFQVDNG
jgi:uncharacterized repeat protein (TIGR01451 family)